MGDREGLTIADDYARGSGAGGRSGEVTGMGGHVRGGTSIHEPVTAATIGARGGGGLEGGEQCGVGVVAEVGGWRVVDRGSSMLGCREEGLVGGGARTEGARVRGTRHRHRVGMDDPGPRVLHRHPWRRGEKCLSGTGLVSAIALAVAVASALSPPAVPAIAVASASVP